MGGSHCVRHCCKRRLRGAERSHWELGLLLLQPRLGAGMALQLRDGVGTLLSPHHCQCLS